MTKETFEVAQVLLRKLKKLETRRTELDKLIKANISTGYQGLRSEACDNYAIVCSDDTDEWKAAVNDRLNELVYALTVKCDRQIQELSAQFAAIK